MTSRYHSVNLKANLNKVPLHAPHFVMLATVWIALRLRIKQPMSDLGFRYKPFLKTLLFCIVPIFLVFRIAIYAHVYRKFFIWTDYVLSLLIIVLVVEEIIYRGIVYPSYRKKYGPRIAILITAVLFAAIHKEPLVEYSQLVIKGALLTWLYEKKEDLLYPVILHSIFLIPAALLEAAGWSVLTLQQFYK